VIWGTKNVESWVKFEGIELKFGDSGRENATFERKNEGVFGVADGVGGSEF
jgi:hypothetical protein